MRRAPVLVLAALAALAAAPAATAATSATDTVLTTATVGSLDITGGVLPTASVNTVIGSTTEVVGGAMTVSDTRGTTGGWDVTARYVNPVGSVTLAGVVTPVVSVGDDNVKVKTAETLSTVLTGTRSYTAGSFVQVDDQTSVNVAGASAASGGGTTTFSTAYQVTVPTNATLGTVYGAAVEYTVAPKVP
ncbi:MAG TPA: hypothetical protein VNU26_11845 [Mycobacteriales bacterium]|nr:hypothetical protein [Mycobacteriales bacterium]